jgi:hypothetical protein
MLASKMMQNNTMK